MSKHPSIAWAKAMFVRPHVLILDTETTGLGDDAEVIEIALIDLQGQVRLNTLVQCQGEIPPQVTALHGINKEMLKDAPLFPQVWNALAHVLAEPNEIIIYNAEYDVRMLRQTAKRYGLPLSEMKTHCLMLHYSEYINEPSWRQPEGYRYQRLSAACDYFGIKQGGSHRALPDVLMTLEVLRKLAAIEEVGH